MDAIQYRLVSQQPHKYTVIITRHIAQNSAVTQRTGRRRFVFAANTQVGLHQKRP